MSTPRLILLSVLVMLSLGLILFYTDSPKSILGQLYFGDEENDSLPYAVIHNASTQHFDTEGALSYTFEASRLNHFRGTETADPQGYTTISDPNIVVFREGNPWKISAKNGRIDSNKIISLQQNVVVYQTQEDGSETTLSTESLTLLPDEKFAFTDQPVTILSPFGTINAVGMEANLAAKTIKLKSKVRGVYEP